MKASIFRLFKAPLDVGGDPLRGGHGALVVVIAVYGIERPRLHAIENAISHGTENPPKHFWTFEMSGLRRPPTVPRARVENRRWR